MRSCCSTTRAATSRRLSQRASTPSWVCGWECRTDLLRIHANSTRPVTHSTTSELFWPSDWCSAAGLLHGCTTHDEQENDMTDRLNVPNLRSDVMGESTRQATRVSARTPVAAVIGATTAAVAIWAVATMADAELIVSYASGQPIKITVVSVVVAALVGSLAGWGLLSLLRRFT